MFSFIQEVTVLQIGAPNADAHADQIDTFDLIIQ